MAGGNFLFLSPWIGLGLLFLCLEFAGDLVAWQSVRGEQTRVTGTACGWGDFGGCGAPPITLLPLSTALPRGSPTSDYSS